jgi:excisionase family DNA binding protein
MPRPKTNKHPKSLFTPPSAPLTPSQRANATREEAAAECRVSTRTLDKWVAQKKIPFYRLSPRMVRFDLDEVAAALRRFKVKEVS